MAAAGKRGGTVDWGRLYEEGVLAHIAIQCTLNPEVEDFELFNNVDTLGAFDDVVLKVKYNSGRDAEMYLFQIKHRDNKNVSIANVFETKNGVFYLPKYEKSFNQICDLYEKDPNSDIFRNIKMENIRLILFSNIKFDDDNVLATKYEFNKENNCSNIMKTFSMRSNIFPYMITNKNPLPEQHEVSAIFLSKCWVYPNQIRASGLEDLISSKLEGIHPDKTKIILNCFARWTRQKKNEKIVKSDMIDLILENYLSYHEIIPSKHLIVDNFAVIVGMLNDYCSFPFIKTTNLDILKNFLLMQIQSFLNLKIYKNLWHKNIDFNQIDDSHIKNLLVKRSKYYGSSKYSDLFFIFWQIKKLPMLLHWDNKNKERIEFVLEKFPNYLNTKTFVLMYLDDVPVINNATNLNQIINYDILNEISISLQGKNPQTLQSLINNNEKVMKTITPDIALDLLVNKKTIGEIPELIPYYISRKIQIPLLQESVLKETNCLFILQDRNCTYIQEYINEYEKYLREKRDDQTNSVKFKFEKVNKLYSDLTTEKLSQLLNKITKFHHILIKEGQYFRVIKSYESINVLRKHLIKEDTYLVKEETMLQSTSDRINIICNTAGMGKTCLLQSIAKNAPPEEWTIHLNLNEHVQKLDSFDYNNNNKKIIDYLVEVVENNNDFKEYLTELILSRSREGHLRLLLDGYDEVYFKKIRQFIDWATKMRMNICITTRPSKIAELEDVLNIFSLKLKHFDHEDQTEFLTQFYKDRDLKTEKIKELVERVEPYCKTFDANFIGIPLQTKLLAEVLVDSTEEKELDLIYLYNKFINKKIKELEEYREDTYKIFCKKMSLTLFFTKDILKEYQIDYTELEAQIKQFKGANKKDFIISGFTKENVPMFVHRTYAEFLAAQYLYEQLTDNTNINKEKWKTLHNKLYYIEMTDVRYFLDRIAATDFELHKYVLKDNLEKVQELLKSTAGRKLCEEKDKLGRTPLELACSYGKRFDLDTKKDIVGLVNLEKHVQIEIGEWSNQYYSWNGYKIDIPLLEQKFSVDLEITKLLINFNTSNIPLDYIMKTGSLEIFNCFTANVELKNLFQDNLQLLLYYCVLHNLDNIVKNIVGKFFFHKLFKKDHILDILYNGFILTHIAAATGNFEVWKVLYKKGAKTKINGKNALNVATENGQKKFAEKLLKYKRKFNMQIDNIAKDDQGLTALHLAVDNNDLLMINFLLSNGADINIRSKEGEHVLHLAYSNGYTEVVKCLLHHDKIDANCINEQDIDGNTPLHTTLFMGHWDIVKLLVLKGANANIKNKRGESVFHFACSSGKIEIVEHLLHHDKIDANCINEQDIDGNTPLHTTLFMGHLDIVKLLVLKGANANIKNKREENMFHVACSSGKIEVVEHLLQHDKIDAICINEQDIYGDTPLNTASYKRHWNIVKLLISKGANANIKNKWGTNAFHLACFWGEIEVVEYLFQHDKIDANCINEQDNNGNTPLHTALFMGHWDIFKLLVLKGANANIKNKRGESVFHFACSSGKIEIVEHLLQHDKIYANCINEQDNNGNTPLHSASLSGNLDNVKLLLLKGANANIKNNWRKNVFHLACSGGEIEVVKHLLQYDKIDANDINEQDIDGNTPLYNALFDGHWDIVKLLLLKGANANIKNNWRKNIFHLACSKGKIEVVEHLLQHDKIDANCINEQDIDGNTPLHSALSEGHWNIVKLLLLKGANANIKNNWRKNIFHLACSKGKIEVVEHLLQHDKIDANCINEQDIDGDTPLHSALSEGHWDIVKLLFLKGANYNITDRYGNTILHRIVYISSYPWLNFGLVTVQEIFTITTKLKKIKNKAGVTPLELLEVWGESVSINEEIYLWLKKLLS